MKNFIEPECKGVLTSPFTEEMYPCPHPVSHMLSFYPLDDNGVVQWGETPDLIMPACCHHAVSLAQHDSTILRLSAHVCYAPELNGPIPQGYIPQNNQAGET